jgi:hypothetical protein
MRWILMALAAGGCSAAYNSHNGELRQACNGGDSSACSAYTAGVSACEKELSPLARATESWSVKKCEGKN